MSPRVPPFWFGGSYGLGAYPAALYESSPSKYAMVVSTHAIIAASKKRNQ
jgi:hypothetical protein